MDPLRLDLAGVHEYQQNRAPFLMIDAAEEGIPGVSAKGHKDLRDEWFFAVHWPGDPNMPGMLQVEALTQLGALMVLTLPGHKGKRVYVTSASHIRWSRKVVPGDRLDLETKLLTWKRGLGKCSGTASRNPKETLFVSPKATCSSRRDRANSSLSSCGKKARFPPCGSAAGRGIGPCSISLNNSLDDRHRLPYPPHTPSMARHKKKHPQQLRDPVALIAEARAQMAAGDFRRANEMVRKAAFRDPANPEIPILEYLVRTKLGEPAAEPSILRTGNFPPQWLGEVVRYAPLPTALRCCQENTLHEILADRLICENGWPHLGQLSGAHPLAQGALVMQSVAAAGNLGQWQVAEAHMAIVPRQSPYAPWRFFCKAMAAFAAQDLEATHQAVARLPPHFVFYDIAQALTGQREPYKGLFSTETTPAPVRAHQEAFVQKLQRGCLNGLKPHLRALAEHIAPENPGAALPSLLLLTGRAAQTENLPLSSVLALTDKAELQKQLRFLFASYQHDAWPIEEAADYWDTLSSDVAKSVLLEHLIRSAQDVTCPGCVQKSSAPLLSRFTKLCQKETLRSALMRESVQRDPSHPEGWQLLISVLKAAEDKPKKRILGEALQQYTEAFPDNPEPWLELTRLYQSRGAYRRAEQAVAAALARAPYDDRIQEQRAIGLLHSARHNRRRRKYALAQRDLETARTFARPTMQPLLWVQEQALLWQQEKTVTLDTSPSPLARVLLAHEIDHPDAKRSLCKDLLSLPSATLRSLFLPLPEDWQALSGIGSAHFVLREVWAELFTRFTLEDFVAVLPSMISVAASRLLKPEIERRLRQSREPLLCFAAALVDALDEQIPRGRPFLDALAAASAKEQEIAKTLAKEAARHVPHGPLAIALQKFDFAFLERLPRSEKELVAALEALIDDTDDYSIEEEIKDFEKMLDEAGVRGASRRDIKLFRGYFRSQPSERRNLDSLARRASSAQLSYEAQVMLDKEPKKRILPSTLGLPF
jgi:3-hydroxyacyl-[acyl-carrier-protein] dehydratase